jgi:hypothetical protein
VSLKDEPWYPGLVAKAEQGAAMFSEMLDYIIRAAQAIARDNPGFSNLEIKVSLAALMKETFPPEEVSRDDVIHLLCTAVNRLR